MAFCSFTFLFPPCQVYSDYKSKQAFFFYSTAWIYCQRRIGLSLCYKYHNRQQTAANKPCSISSELLEWRELIDLSGEQGVSQE